MDTFRRREEQATDSMAELDRASADQGAQLHRWQAVALSRVASRHALDELAEAGLLPETVAQRAAEGLQEAITE